MKEKKLRTKKRKISEVDHDRVPVTKFDGDSRNVSESSSTATKDSELFKQPVQQTLSQAWSSSTGDPTKLTPARQNKIDYFLLRFIVCCSIAFAVLDNGFFWDFVTCL
jgi:hypothetical protein